MQTEKKKFYQTKWFLWLWLIVFPPIGIILLWTCHKQKKKESRIVLSVVFIIWFIILMVATKDGPSTTPTTEPASSVPSIVSTVEESSIPQDVSESGESPNKMPREISVQDAEDACNSFFTEIIINAYDEIPWGEGMENGIIIESHYDVESQSGTVTISYTLMDEPHTGTHIAITFTLEEDKVSVSEILVDGIKAEVPDEAKESVLIWLLLDSNYQG